MSHGLKVVSLAAALLVFVGGVSLAGPPDPTKPVLAPPAPFWFLLPTENAKIPAKTAFIVILKATNPPPHIYLEWQQKVNTSWWPLYFKPTGLAWRTPSELPIPVAEGSFQQTGYYRVRATWDWKYYTDWRHFQIIPIIPRATLIPQVSPKLYPKPKIGPPPVEQQNVPQR